MGPPSAGKSLVRHSDSEISGSDVEDGKRLKLGSPLVQRAEKVVSEMETDGALTDGRQSRSRRKHVKQTSGAGATTGVAAGAAVGAACGAVGATAVSKMGAISGELVEMVIGSGMTNEEKVKVLALGKRYEVLLTGLMLENADMAGRLSVLQSPGMIQQRSAVIGGAVGGAVTAAVGSGAAAPVPKVQETWSAVVRAKDGISSKEVVNKVMREVAPELGTRVHEVRQIKDGAIIRTASVAERRKIVENKKFQEVGLEVSYMDKLGPRIVVQQVQTVVSAEEFMDSLYSMNLAEMMSKEVFARSVRLVSSPWKEGEGYTNVTLECTARVAEHLRVTGVYIKWFRFLVRVVDAVQACHRCYGFDHRVRECRFRSDVCRLCGQEGHQASRCMNPAHCRNCALRRQAADHPMMSLQCPAYAMMVARANARH